MKHGLKLLILLTNYRTLTISEATRLLDLPRTIGERIMVTLESEAFIARLPDSKRYALAPRVLALWEGSSAEDRLVEFRAPLLFAKTREIRWPLALATPLRERMSVRVTTDAATSLDPHKRHIGSEIAVAEASSGIVHLAFLEPAEPDAQIHLLAEATSPSQPIAQDRSRLDELISAARRDGYSVDPVRGPEGAQRAGARGRPVRAILVMMYMARAISGEALAERFVPQMKAFVLGLEAQAFGHPTRSFAEPVT